MLMYTISTFFFVHNLVLQLTDGEITAADAASLSNKLCQMLNGAVYGANGEVVRIHDRKFDALEDILEAANGLHIPFSKRDSDVSISRWNAGELPVALIHPASVGHGLNLQSGGSTLVWFGITCSLELYSQTVARLWRQSQVSETMVVQYIVVGETIDERRLKAISDLQLLELIS